MLKHAITLAVRNFRRHKSSFIINLIGLSTGLACALLIFLWVNDELKMDKFHANDDRLFRVMEHQDYAESIMTTTSTPGLLAETLKEEFPEIEHASTITWPNRYTLSVGEKNIGATAYHADVDFFHMFSFDLLVGQPGQLLKSHNELVLSRSTAENLFETVDNAIGQSLEINHDEVYSIAGVFEDPPQNSQKT